MNKTTSKHVFSDWRSVRMWESRVAQNLRRKHSLWLHGFCIGAITLMVTWGISALQMHWGVQSLALRYLLALGAGYVVFLCIVRLWAATLVQRSPSHWDGSGLDVPDIGSFGSNGSSPVGGMQSGGGDFGGGGASGDFGIDTHLADASTSDGVSELAGGAIEVAAASDEAAVVVVPVVVLFLIGCAVFFGAGALALLYFGWEVLLAVAVELAFTYAAATTAVRVSREGWASAALRLTWKPLAGAIVCAALLGASIDYFLPAANSLPQALKLLT